MKAATAIRVPRIAMIGGNPNLSLEIFDLALRRIKTSLSSIQTSFSGIHALLKVANALAIIRLNQAS